MKLTDLSDADTGHKNILRLAVARAANDYELGVWLAAAHRLGLWKALGIASFVEYAGRYLGVKPRPAQGAAPRRARARERAEDGVRPCAKAASTTRPRAS